MLTRGLNVQNRFWAGDGVEMLRMACSANPVFGRDALLRDPGMHVSTPFERAAPDRAGTRPYHAPERNPYPGDGAEAKIKSSTAMVPMNCPPSFTTTAFRSGL